jgi:O-antigen/teichoic acid export membrane protein
VTIKNTVTPFWLRYLPSFLRTRITSHPSSITILSNIGWLFSDTLLRMIVGLLVGIWIARYLGPDRYGLLNYAIAFVSLFSAVASMGLQDIVVRDIVRNPTSSPETMGTSFLLRLVGGLIAFMLILASISFLQPKDALTVGVVAIIGFTLIFQASDVIKYWFESQVQSKYNVWVQNGALLIFAAVKVMLILLEAELLAFVWAMFAEALIVAIGLFAIYLWKGGKLSAWSPGYTRAKSLLRDSWPLILSAIAITVYMRIDQIMIGQMLGNKAVGIYTAAVRISELWYFIPVAIVASVFPSILEAKKKNEAIYIQRLQRLFDLMVLLSLAVALPMTFLSDWIVLLLFGPDYIGAGAVLAIHVWAALFVFLGVANSRWFIAENRQILSLQRTLLGALANVGLNLLMIPKFGIIGAAYATVLSYAIAVLFTDVLQKETRPLFVMKIKSLNILRLAEHALGKNI